MDASKVHFPWATVGTLAKHFCPSYKQEEEEDDDWGEDTTEEAQRRRMDEISDHAKVLTLSDDLERTVEERVNILFDFVKVKYLL